MTSNKSEPLFLTFDVEPFWTNIPVRYSRDSWKTENDSSVFWTNAFIEYCEKNNLSATFFIVGKWAQLNEKVVKRIAKNLNFKLGSHSFWHEDLAIKSDKDFLEDVSSSKKIIEDLTSLEITRFRAPSFSISFNQFYLLEEAGYKIDSSMSLAKRIYGTEYKPINTSIKLVPFEGAELFGRNLTLLGGGYLRLMPTSILRLFSNRYLGNMVYLHPHDLPNKIDRFDKFTSSENLRKTIRFGDMFKKLDVLSNNRGFKAL